MDFGEKVTKRANELRLDIKEVARMAGIPYSTFRRQLSPRAQKRPAAPQGIALARTLNCAIEWLFDDSRDFPAPPYHEPPPFELYPWPPELISWNELRLLLLGYANARLAQQKGESAIPAEQFNRQEGIPVEDDAFQEKLAAAIREALKNYFRYEGAPK